MASEIDDRAQVELVALEDAEDRERPVALARRCRPIEHADAPRPTSPRPGRWPPVVAGSIARGQRDAAAARRAGGAASAPAPARRRPGATPREVDGETPPGGHRSPARQHDRARSCAVTTSHGRRDEARERRERRRARAREHRLGRAPRRCARTGRAVAPARGTATPRPRATPTSSASGSEDRRARPSTSVVGERGRAWTRPRRRHAAARASASDDDDRAEEQRPSSAKMNASGRSELRRHDAADGSASHSHAHSLARAPAGAPRRRRASGAPSRRGRTAGSSRATRGPASPGWRAGRRRRRACAWRRCGGARGGGGPPGPRPTRRRRCTSLCDRARVHARAAGRQEERARILRLALRVDHAPAARRASGASASTHAPPERHDALLAALAQDARARAGAGRRRRDRARTARSRAGPSRRAARGSRGRGAPDGRVAGWRLDDLLGRVDGEERRQARGAPSGVASSSAGHVAMCAAAAQPAHPGPHRGHLARDGARRVACARARASQPAAGTRRWRGRRRAPSSRARARTPRRPRDVAPYSVDGPGRRAPLALEVAQEARRSTRRASRASATTGGPRPGQIPGWVPR